MSYIKQKPTKTITGAYITTDADNGYRIICNSSSNFIVTLHSPTGRHNFDLEIDNKGIGVITVGGKELSQGTHAHIGNNNGTEWVVSLGGGGGTEYELPQATETTLGGIKAKAKTTETVEVSIDSATGKAYVPAAGEATIISGTTAQRPTSTKTDDTTKLLLHLDSDFTDSCGKTVTANGNAQISTVQKKFGSGSALFDGSGDYLSVSNSTDWQFGSGDFTVECRFYINTIVSYGTLVGYRASAGTYGAWDLCLESGKPKLLCSDGSGFDIDIKATTAVSAGAWHHIAGERYGNVFTLYLDGFAVATITKEVPLAALSIALSIGALANGDEAFNGYIDEVRVSKGIAIYKGNFTPSDAAYIWESIGLQVGLPYFDTTLNKPVWSNGIAWVDATGTTV